MEPGYYKKSGIEVNKSLTIQGKGSPETVIIDGENKDSIIKVSDSDIKLTIKNITFINALNNQNNGGAIQFYSTGELIIDNCIFIDNKVTTSDGEGLGGGIYAHGDALKFVTLKVTNSKFLNNYAFTDGGAINSKFGTVTISNCIFDNNSADRDGGAVGTRGLANVDISNSVFSNNHATEWGGAINNWLAKFSIDSCDFINNSAITEGGAISNCGSLTKIINSKFINNSAREGGAIHSHKDAMDITVITDNDEFLNNTATKGSTIFIAKYTTGTFDFDNNYWGSDDPDWEKEFYTNDVCSHPTSWLKTVDSTILANNIKRAYNSPYDFTATFLDKLGRPMKNTRVTFKLNNKEYYATTDSNGIARLTLKLDVGKYSITSINPTTCDELIKTATIIERITGNKNINAYYLNGAYKVRAIDDDGNPVKAGQIVTFKIGKNTYNIKTDNKGYASLKLTNAPGKYSITASYKGSAVKNNVKVKHVLKASSISKKKAKKIRYSAKLTGKNIKNKKITFKINGKTYSAHTNKKGKATVNLKNLKTGKYKITIKYVKDSIKKTVKIK